jgi:hypothetical protein
MDPLGNPFAPGAGTPPPELAGRESEINKIELLMRRVEAGRHERSLLITGLRGVGKTVLLNRFESLAEDGAWSVALREMKGPKDRPQPFRAVMAEMCRRALLDLGRDQQVADVARRALGALRSFRLSATVHDTGAVEYSLGVEPLQGVADSGQLDLDLGDLFIELGRVARAKHTGVLLLLDEVQNLEQPDLAALIAALRRVDQKNLPLTAVAAGLPQLPVLAGEAKSYAERLFEFRSIGQLSVEATRQAFVGADESVEWTGDALDLLVESTDRYPHFIQEWGKKVWEAASASPVQAGDVERARAHVIAALDTGFFKLRSDRATGREREYMATMARLGNGPYRSGEVARQMGGKKGGASVGVFRDNLIRKGLIYAPDHGLVDFTVPHFGEYMRRNHLT